MRYNFPTRLILMKHISQIASNLFDLKKNNDPRTLSLYRYVRSNADSRKSWAISFNDRLGTVAYNDVVLFSWKIFTQLSLARRRSKLYYLKA